MKSIARPLLLSALVLSTTLAAQAEQSSMKYNSIDIVAADLPKITQRQTTIKTLMTDWSLSDYQKQKYGSVDKIVGEIVGETKYYSAISGRCEFKIVDDGKNILLSLKATPAKEASVDETFMPLEVTLQVAKDQTLVVESERDTGDGGGYLIDQMRFVSTDKNQSKVLSPVVLEISSGEALVGIHLKASEFQSLSCLFVESGNFDAISEK